MTAYVVMTRERVTNPAELEVYAQKARAAREGHPMERLAFYGDIDVLEGSPIDGCVILSFPTITDARRWYESPRYQDARNHRQNGAEYRVFITEGLAAAAPSTERGAKG